MWRLSRIRFIVIRSCVISTFIVLILQLNDLYSSNNNNNNSFHPLERLKTAEEKFWEKLLLEDQHLSNADRVHRIKSFEKQFENDNLNWTAIFFESYRRKLSVLQQRDSTSHYKFRFRLENEPNLTQQSFYIYMETPVYGTPKFCSSSRIFHPECPYQNCRLTCEPPTVRTTGVRRASIFHHEDVKTAEVQKKLEHRSFEDIWILWSDEANKQIEHLNQFYFNWTIGFRLDAEVSFGTYGILIEQQRKTTYSKENNTDFLFVLRQANIEIKNPLLEYRILENFRYRSKHALWFVSNCNPKRRLNYYSELKLHYPVKAFGKCGEYQCEKGDQCETEQSYLALFYLAFESQRCLDYVTEKFWRALHFGMIPIALGPTKQCYLDLGIPESAFIHVDDFKSERLLANHLHQISNDYLLYRQYFQWLNQYAIFHDINVLEPIRMCELCMKLNLYEYQDHSYYVNFFDWQRMDC